MEKKYYRMVAGANPPDPALMGDPNPNVPFLLDYLGRLGSKKVRRRKPGKISNFNTTLKELNRVAKVKRGWKNNG